MTTNMSDTDGGQAPNVESNSPNDEALIQKGGATGIESPSRTAGIERALTVGVQGPAKLAVLFVDDLT